MDVNQRIYLDHNATTPLHPEVLEAMLPFFREFHGNPSSIHAEGSRAREAIDEARALVAGLIGAAPEEVHFTSGGSEADNWALKGGINAAAGRRRILVSKVEHHAVWQTCQYLAKQGRIIEYLPVDADGRVDPDAVAALLGEEVALVTVMHANNETGVIQPVDQIGPLTRHAGVPFHIDAVQSFGKIPVHVDELGADMLALSAHKINGPKGVGALYIRRGTKVENLLEGGGHEYGRRGGTENVAGIVGFGRAAELAVASMAKATQRIELLRDRLEQKLVDAVEAVVVNGGGAERLANTLNLAFSGVEAEGIVLGLDLAGIAVSSGSACSAGTSAPSHVLLAMGLEPRLAAAAVRFSLGKDTTEAEVDRVVEVLPPLVARLRAMSMLV